MSDRIGIFGYIFFALWGVGSGYYIYSPIFKNKQKYQQTQAHEQQTVEQEKLPPTISIENKK